MNILFVASHYPMADRNSGDFRLSQLMHMCTEDNNIYFLALSEKEQTKNIGEEALERYKEALCNSSITILMAGIHHALTCTSYAVVIFEWHFTAKYLAKDVRLFQPQAHLIIDSVDVVYNRYEAKARLTGNPLDVEKAKQTKQTELAVYKSADLVITISDDDARILHKELPETPTFTISNIHPIPALTPQKKKTPKQLLFIGSFTHEPNIDAITYFCSEILPIIQSSDPDVTVCIVGNAPTHEVLALASGSVKVLGYVPETTPYLEESLISIAPLRFGGGVKGKVGEAMSYALPIVSTSIGAEGLGITPSVHLLVCDDAESFAAGVIALIKNKTYRVNLGLAARQFIIDNYSDTVANNRIRNLLSNLNSYKVNQPSKLSLLTRSTIIFWKKYIAWRFK